MVSSPTSVLPTFFSLHFLHPSQLPPSQSQHRSLSDPSLMELCLSVSSGMLRTASASASTRRTYTLLSSIEKDKARHRQAVESWTCDENEFYFLAPTTASVPSSYSATRSRSCVPTISRSFEIRVYWVTYETALEAGPLLGETIEYLDEERSFELQASPAS